MKKTKKRERERMSDKSALHTSAFKAMQRKVEVKISKQGKYSYDDDVNVVVVVNDDDGTRAPTERLTYNLDRCTHFVCFMYIQL